MTKGEKLKAFIDYLNTSKNGFATSIGVSSTVINGIVNDTHNPGHKVLAAVSAKYPDFNLDWFLNDKGEMVLNSDIPSNSSKDYLQEYLQKLEGQFERLLSQLEVKDRQIERLMDLLGKPDVSEDVTCRVVSLTKENAA